MAKTLSVTSDFVFKRIFAKNSISRGFLSAILIGEGKILPVGATIVDLREAANEQDQMREMNAENPSHGIKRMVIDVKLQSEDHLFIIEVQKRISKAEIFLKRVQLYSAVAHANQAIKGTADRTSNDYLNALPVICISIIDIHAQVFDNDIPAVSYHQMLETTTKSNQLKAFAYVFLELKKVKNLELPDIDVNEWLKLLIRQDFGGNEQYRNVAVKEAETVIKSIWDRNYENYISDYFNELADAEMLDAAETRAEQERARADAEKARADAADERAAAADARADAADAEKARAADEIANLKRKLAELQDGGEGGSG